MEDDGAQVHRVTVLGEYHLPHAALNSLWAARDQQDWFPDTVLLVAAKRQARDGESPVTRINEELLKGWHHTYGGGPDVRTVPVDPASPKGVRYNVKRELDRLRKDEGDLDVAFDITPGRTLVKIGLLDVMRELDPPPAHVFYLDARDYDYRALPYPVIPRRIQWSRDRRDQVIPDAEA